MFKSFLILIFCIQSPLFAMDEALFEKTAKDVLSLYENEIRANYDSINLELNWQSTTPNASASHRNNNARLTFHGELIRKHQLTRDGFALTVCHEIGHLVGGAPKVYPTKKYTSEAQSDYFAITQCLPRYFEKFPSEDFSIDGIDSKILKKCKSKSCLRALAAINSDRKVYQGKTSLLEKDNTIVRVTNFNDYPSPQCRVDTLKAGLFKQKRPTCWFSEKSTFNEGRYIQNYEYFEAQIVATANKVTLTPNGCHIQVKAIDFYQGSYLSPLYESEIYSQGIFQVGDCKLKDGGSFSGAITEYESNLYLNLVHNDK